MWVLWWQAGMQRVCWKQAGLLCLSTRWSAILSCDIVCCEQDIAALPCLPVSALQADLVLETQTHCWLITCMQFGNQLLVSLLPCTCRNSTACTDSAQQRDLCWSGCPEALPSPG